MNTFANRIDRLLIRIPVISAVRLWLRKRIYNPTYPGSFHVKIVQQWPEGEDFSITLVATAKRGQQVAQFRIHMLLKPPRGFPPLAFSQGTLRREQGVDGTWFLNELAEVFVANSIPTEVPRVHALDFRMAILGMGMSRSGSPDEMNASISSKPPGHWIATKAFVGDDSSEFYLNVNPVEGVGEFSIKDESYGDAVIRELATLFLPS